MTSSRRARPVAVSIILAAAAVLAPARVAADPPSIAFSPDDAGLFECGKAQELVDGSLAADTKLQELVTWARSFTCTTLVYRSAIAARPARVVVKSPDRMTARSAWQVFLIALQSMGLQAVRCQTAIDFVPARGAASSWSLRAPGDCRVESRRIRSELVPARGPLERIKDALTLYKGGAW